MKVLVTGASGFLGGFVVDRLFAHGYRDIRCLVRARSRRDRLESIVARHPGARIDYFVGNLSSRRDTAAAVSGVDAVVHLAAAMKGAAADMVSNTVVASRNLLDAIGDRNAMRVVLVSSFSVYGVADLGRGALVDESTPLEPHPERRDAYTYSKLRQEQLFRDYQRRNGFELVVLRPGVIYGSGGSHLSVRVGFSVFGLFLSLGGGNLLPLTYVDNCAEAIVTAGLSPDAAGGIFNVVDDDLPTCRQYLRRYKSEVRKIRSISIPYVATNFMSRWVERYHAYSKGQLPAVITPYLTATLWGGNRFDNSRLKGIGWKPLFSTRDGLNRAFEAFRSGPT